MIKESLLKALRISAIIQAVALVIVLVLSWLFVGMLDLFVMGTIYTWVGVVILLIAGFFSIGGFFSKAEDLTAFSLSGAGKMDTHMENIRTAGQVRLIYVLVGFANGILPTLLGYLFQKWGA